MKKWVIWGMLVCLVLGLMYSGFAEDEVHVVQIASGHWTPITYLLLSDGTVRCYGGGTDYDAFRESIQSWTSILEISAKGDAVAGMTADGKVLIQKMPGQDPIADAALSDAVAKLPEAEHIYVESSYLLVLDTSHVLHLISWADVPEPFLDADGMTDVSEVYASAGCLLARKLDGSWQNLFVSKSVGRNAENIRFENVQHVCNSDEYCFVVDSDGAVSMVFVLLPSTYLPRGLNKEGLRQLAFSQNTCETLSLYANGSAALYCGKRKTSFDASKWQNIVSIACTWNGFIGLRADGSVVTYSDSPNAEELDIDEMFLKAEDSPKVTAVCGGSLHTLLLLENGKVMACGISKYGCCDVNEWTDIVGIAAGWTHSVGLRADGTVVAAGQGRNGECEVDDWTDIVAIGAGRNYTLGLDSEGSLYVAGLYTDEQKDLIQRNGGLYIPGVDLFGSGNFSSHFVYRLKDSKKIWSVPANAIEDQQWDYHELNLKKQGGVSVLPGWFDVKSMATSEANTLLVLNDGTVLADGYNEYGETDTDSLQHIIQAAAGTYHTVFLTEDGHVIALGSNSAGACNTQAWSDVISISSGQKHTLGLRADGKVYVTGSNDYGQCDIPASYLADTDDACFTPVWRVYMDHDLYGQWDTEAWKPYGFIVYEKPSSTTLGVNHAGPFNGAFAWEGICVSLPRSDGKPDSIHVLQCEEGDVLWSQRFFLDGTLKYTKMEGGWITEYERENDAWTMNGRNVDRDDLPETLQPYADLTFEVSIDERQEGKLHYGSYKVSSLNDEADDPVFTMEISHNGSVKIEWQGQVQEYNAPKDAYTVLPADK